MQLMFRKRWSGRSFQGAAVPAGLLLLTALGTAGCGALPGSEAEGAFIDGEYINAALQIRIRPAGEWDTVSSAKQQAWQEAARPLLEEGTGFIEETVLFSLENVRTGNDRFLKMSVLDQRKIPRVRTARAYALMYKDLFDTAFQKAGINVQAHCDTVIFSGRAWDRTHVIVSKGFRSSSVQLFFLYYRGTIVTVVAGYSSDDDLAVIKECLGTLRVGERF